MELVTDPVCEMEFDKLSAAAWSVHQDRVYYFCHPACKKIFDADPAQFVQAKQAEATGAPRRAWDEHEKRENLKPDCEWISSAGSAKR